MKEKIKNSKLKISIGIIIILFVILFLNYNNILKLLHGNVLNSTLEQSQITNEMINDMNDYDILAEVQGRKEDNKLQYFLFNDNNIPIFTYDSGNYEESYKLKVILKYQSNHKDLNGNLITKKAKISLKEGVRLVNNGSSEVLNYLKDKDVKNINHTNYLTKKVYTNSGYTTLKVSNGDIEYEFDSSVETVTFNIVIAGDSRFDFETINDAIEIELIENGEVKKIISKSVQTNFNAIPIMINGSIFPKAYGGVSSDIISYNFKDNLAGIYSWNKKERNLLYDYIKIVVKVPNKVKLIDTMLSGTSTTTIGLRFEGKNLEGYDQSIAAPNTEILLQKYDENYNTYTFIAHDHYTHAFGVIPVWDFSKYKVNDEVVIEGLNVTYKLYGKEETIEALNVEGISRLNSRDVYTIVDKEQIKVSSTEYTIYAYDERVPDDEIHFGSYQVINDSPYASKPKDFTFKFDNKFGITSVIVSIMDRRPTLNVSYKKKWYDDELKKWKVDESYTNKTISEFYDRDKGTSNYQYTTDRAIINQETLGLNDNEYIDELVVHNLVVPGQYQTYAPHYYYTYYGRILDKSNNIFETYLGVSNYNNESCLKGECDSKKIVNKLDLDKKYLTAAPFLINKSNIIFESGNTYNFVFDIKETTEKNTYYYRKTYNPIIYIRSEMGLPISNIVLKNYENIDLIKKYNIKIESYKEESTSNNKLDCELGSSCIYKIDTKDIPKDKALVGFNSHRLKNSYSTGDKFNEFNMQISFDMDAPVEYADGSNIHNIKNMIFVTDNYSNDTVLYQYNNQKGDPYDVDLDGKTDDDAMSYLNTNYYYQIISNNDISSIIKQKLDTEEEYKIWKNNNDNSFLNVNNKLNLQLELNNNSNKNMGDKDEILLYIPIPKVDQNWGELSNNKKFLFSLELVDKLKNNRSDSIIYDIYYGINIMPKLDYNSLKEINLDALVHEDNISNEQLKNVNLIVIKFSRFDINNKFVLDFNLNLFNKKYQYMKEQVINYVLYRSISTIDGEKKSGFVLGNSIGLTNEMSKYKLNIKYIDVYGKILYEDEIPKSYMEEYQTDTKEFDNYELYTKPNNSDGIIENDTTIIYIYKSLEERKVIVHYYEEGTKNKLLEDKIIYGKDLEKFIIKPEIIEGYNIIDDRQIEGIFKENTNEYIYEYKKIIIPSTYDNIVISIITFIISIITTVLILIYIKKKKLK